MAPVRVCTKVMALQPGPREGRTVKLLGFDVMWLCILLEQQREVQDHCAFEVLGGEEEVHPHSLELAV